MSRALLCLAIALGWLDVAARADTIIAVKRSKEFVIVAADSRVTASSGQRRAYEKCKITLLDARSFFAIAGVVSSKASSAGKVPFDAQREAARQFAPQAGLEAVADRWATVMQQKLSDQPESWKREILRTLVKFHAEDNIIAQGIFGTAGEIADALDVAVNYNTTPQAISFSHREPRAIADDAAGLSLFGTLPGRSVVTDLLHANTPSASSWRARIADQAIKQRLGQIDSYAFAIKAALEAAIAANVDPAIGGSVAVLVLERGLPARWFSRPATCRR
jgi:hypothetical protein